MERTTKSKKYIETVGRRKTATARVRVTAASKGSFDINGKDLATYFPTPELQKTITDAFVTSEVGNNYVVTVRVVGGGIHAQAEAVRHGISRALVEENEEVKPKLKRAGYLKRDPRVKERRKFGLKKARKSPQWSKR